MEYLQVLISAEDTDQAGSILDALLAKKLVLGGPILQGPAKFWWKGEIVEMPYCYILTYSKEYLKEQIIEEIKKISVEEIPMVSFLPMSGNPELLKLIDDTLIK